MAVGVSLHVRDPYSNDNVNAMFSAHAPGLCTALTSAHRSYDNFHPPRGRATNAATVFATGDSDRTGE